MSAIDKAKSAVLDALAKIDRELEFRMESARTGPSVPQLLHCKSHLQMVLHELETNQMPPKEKRNRGMGRMITDSWPLKNELSEAVLKAEHAYLKL